MMEKEKILNKECIFYPITHRLNPGHECYAWALVRPVRVCDDGGLEVKIEKIEECKACKILSFMKEGETVTIFPDEISTYKERIYIYE